MNICVVCSGNICRSPFVEYILKRELQSHNVCSAGTLGIFGSGAYQECVYLAPNYRIDLRSHRSMGLSRKIIAQSDLLIGMTREHCHFILEFEAELAKVKLIGNYLPGKEAFDVGRLGKVRKGDDIPDPMGMPANEVRPVLDILEIAACRLAKEIGENHE